MIAGTTCEPVVRGEAGVDPGEVVADPGPAVVADAEVAGGPRNVIPPLLLVAVVGSTAVDDAVFAPSPQPANAAGLDYLAAWALRWAQASMSPPSIASASSSGKASGVQANAGMPRAARAAATSTR